MLPAVGCSILLNSAITLFWRVERPTQNTQKQTCSQLHKFAPPIVSRWLLFIYFILKKKTKNPNTHYMQHFLGILSTSNTVLQQVIYNNEGMSGKPNTKCLGFFFLVYAFENSKDESMEN